MWQNRSEKVTNENDKDIYLQIYSPIDDLRLIIIMEYQKIINLSNNTLNQLTKFRTKNWAEIIDDARGTYNTNSQIKFKT